MGNSFRLHSMDIMKAEVYNKHIPAAEQGDPYAAKECGKYFELVDDLDKAVKYYKMYLAVVDDDMYTKMKLKALNVKRIKRGIFG